MLSWEEKLERLRDPVFQEELLSSEPIFVGEFEAYVTRSFDKMFILGPQNNYEPHPSTSIAAIAEREGRRPVEVALEALMADDGRGTIYFPLFNYADGDLEVLRELHVHPRTRTGLSDGARTAVPSATAACPPSCRRTGPVTAAR